jgi:adenylate kinase
VRLILLGRQGAGKGTQAIRIAGHYRVPHISTGEMLRAAVEEGTDFGRKAKEYMDRGELLPDDVMIGIVDERLAMSDAAAGFVLDGFPRTAAQAEALDEIVGDRPIDVVANLEVPEDIVIERLLARGRHDDTEEALRRRLALYEEQTRPLLEHYATEGKLTTVDGVGTEDEVFERLVAATDAAMVG